MPDAQFSEFAYGYAVIREAEQLLTRLGAAITGAPVLPSLITENTVGYDANLVAVDFSLFLQFKRSFHVSALHPVGPCGSPGGRPHCTWAYWMKEHYRFAADTTSNQFHAMRGYEDAVALGYTAGLSVYTAPGFATNAELDQAYQSGAILDRSVAVLPSEFDAVSNGPHKYSFLPDLSRGVITSAPVRAGATPLDQLITDTVEARVPRVRDDAVSLQQWAAGLSERLADGQREPRDRLIRAAEEGATGPILQALRDTTGYLGGTVLMLGRHRP
ncbi:hypothetical protein [Ruania zhangjianzhongii]|uniref:hypothetical protein n=1 Tax=Ruania zhangjianzhongii TaxID=2603206 RepID=UPI0011C96589|nr:hypothetical protein [Ruania zhangjianzhongii]